VYVPMDMLLTASFMRWHKRTDSFQQE
jgi:hypothetical protein